MRSERWYEAGSDPRDVHRIRTAGHLAGPLSADWLSRPADVKKRRLHPSALNLRAARTWERPSDGSCAVTRAASRRRCCSDGCNSARWRDLRRQRLQRPASAGRWPRARSARALSPSRRTRPESWTPAHASKTARVNHCQHSCRRKEPLRSGRRSARLSVAAPRRFRGWQGQFQGQSREQSAGA